MSDNAAHESAAPEAPNIDSCLTDLLKEAQWKEMREFGSRAEYEHELTICRASEFYPYVSLYILKPCFRTVC